METDNSTATEQVQRLLGDKHTKSVEIALLTKELKGLKNSGMNRKIGSQGYHRSTAKNVENPFDKYAITIVNSEGKVSSPFATRK